MGLTLVSDDNLLCPMFVCEECGNPIESLGRGMNRGVVLYVATYDDRKEVIGPMNYVHRGDCETQFTFLRRRIRFSSRELDAFVSQLVFNTSAADRKEFTK